MIYLHVKWLGAASQTLGVGIGAKVCVVPSETKNLGSGLNRDLSGPPLRSGSLGDHAPSPRETATQCGPRPVGSQSTQRSTHLGHFGAKRNPADLLGGVICFLLNIYGIYGA